MPPSLPSIVCAGCALFAQRRGYWMCPLCPASCVLDVPTLPSIVGAVCHPPSQQHRGFHARLHVSPTGILAQIIPTAQPLFEQTQSPDWQALAPAPATPDTPQQCRKAFTWKNQKVSMLSTVHHPLGCGFPSLSAGGHLPHPHHALCRVSPPCW